MVTQEGVEPSSREALRSERSAFTSFTTGPWGQLEESNPYHYRTKGVCCRYH